MPRILDYRVIVWDEQTVKSGHLGVSKDMTGVPSISLSTLNNVFPTTWRRAHIQIFVKWNSSQINVGHRHLARQLTCPEHVLECQPFSDSPVTLFLFCIARCASGNREVLWHISLCNVFTCEHPQIVNSQERRDVIPFLKKLSGPPRVTECPRELWTDPVHAYCNC